MQKWLRFGFAKKLWFSVRFRFYKINCSFDFFGPINCQPKLLRTRSAEIRHEEKYFDCWSHHVARWTVNKTTWKTVRKPPKSVCWKLNYGKLVFGFWILRSVRFGSVFIKPISDIFIGFCTSLIIYCIITLANPSIYKYSIGNTVHLKWDPGPTFSKVPRKILGRFHISGKS